MRERRRWTVHDLRRDNRSVLLSSLFFDQPRSRPELSAATGLSPASVSNVVRRPDRRRDRGRGRVGRLRRRPAAHPAAGQPGPRLLIGVDVGETRVRVELFDLTLTERAKTDYPLDPRQHDVGVIVEAILAGLDEVLARSGVSPSAVLGIGIGVPGIVENGPDALVHGQTYGWDSGPAGTAAAGRTSLPLYIDNGAKTMGQAELWFGARARRQARGRRLIGSGVGASIIANGAAYAARPRSAVEWGHTTVMVGGRPLPVRVARLPGGLRRRRGDPRRGTAARCPHRPGGRACGPDRPGPDVAARRRRSWTTPRCTSAAASRPDQPVQSRADHPRRLGRPAARRAAAARDPRGGPRALAALPVRRDLDRAWPPRPGRRCPRRRHAAHRGASQRDRVHRQVHPKRQRPPRQAPAPRLF